MYPTAASSEALSPHHRVLISCFESVAHKFRASIKTQHTDHAADKSTNKTLKFKGGPGVSSLSSMGTFHLLETCCLQKLISFLIRAQLNELQQAAVALCVLALWMN